MYSNSANTNVRVRCYKCGQETTGYMSFLDEKGAWRNVCSDCYLTPPPKNGLQRLLDILNNGPIKTHFSGGYSDYETTRHIKD